VSLDLKYARNNPYLPYSRLLTRWESVFGRDSIVVRPFEKESLVAGDLIDDFLEQIGIDSFTGKREKTSNLNVALTGRKLQVIDYIRDVVKGPSSAVGAFSRQFVERYAEELKLDQGGTDFISPELARKLLEASSRDNQEIARRYLGREHLFLNSSVSERYQVPQALTVGELEEIRSLVTTDLALFGDEASSNAVSGSAGSLRHLKLRSGFARKQVYIGNFRFSVGRLLRIGRVLKARLAQ
jgi:hypothetical protein